MLPVRITVIGVGSASFGSSTVACLLRSERLRGSHLTLVDLDARRVEWMTALARRLNQEWDAGWTIAGTTERAEALPGAEFVVVSVEVGPREKLWRLDWEIPLRHGLRQPYGENGGPGGWAHTARQVPLQLEIARDMVRLCPEAWLINFSNPLPRLCLAITRHTPIRTIGLCHQLAIGYLIVGIVLGEDLGIEVPPGLETRALANPGPHRGPFIEAVKRRVDILAGGLNHFTWMLDIRDRQSGSDLYPRFRERFLGSSPAGFQQPLTAALFRAFGLCPVPGDEHLAEYLPWCHDPLSRPWERYDLRLYEWDRRAEQREEGHRRIAAHVEGRESTERFHQVTSEGVAEAIEAIAGNLNLVMPAVNLPNGGAIPNLPPWAMVEVPAVLNGKGPHPLCLPPLPEAVAELLRREATVARLAADSAALASRELALQALLLDPMINDLDRAQAILDDYLSAFQEYLPEYT